MSDYITKIYLHSEREYILYPQMEFVIYIKEKIKISKGYKGIIRSKSNLKKKGLVIVNDSRIINPEDDDIFIVFANLTDTNWIIEEDQIIAKLLIVPDNRNNITFDDLIEQSRKTEFNGEEVINLTGSLK